MITGDGNLVEVLATVRYRVADPRVYLFAARDPDAVIRAAAESVLRELVAGRAVPRPADRRTAAAFEREGRRARLRLRRPRPAAVWASPSTG